MTRFEELLQKRVILFDGAMGTSIQSFGLTPEDFGGSRYEGCNEHLNLTRPDLIEQIHAAYFEAGSDVVETNTFGASDLVLGEYGLDQRAFDINKRAAEIARKVAHEFSTPSRPRFVAGSVGPGTRLPSLGQISFRELYRMYRTQAAGLLEGGVDLFIVETCQDPLQTKAALAAITDVLREKGHDLPIIVQITIEKDLNTMLIGTDVQTAITIFEPYPILALGLNCATGPDDMKPHVRTLSRHSPKPISVQPNAGIPENVGGRAVYRLTPEELAKAHASFIAEDGVRIVGGCCGTNAEHIRAVAEAIRNIEPARRQVTFEPGIASLYQAVPLKQTPPPLIIGERTNANGSKKFRELLLQDQYDQLVQIARGQEEDGAHALDVCTAYAGRDEVRDMTEVIRRLTQHITIPLFIDSTEPEVIEAALQLIGGRAVINSINLENGEERLEAILPLCKKYGAAVVALTIDEDGMALTADKKLTIARRLYRLATEKYGLRPQDLLFDPLTFTLANPEYAGAGIETLKAIRSIKQEFPDSFTLLGISNVSFGLNPYARKILNSVFLYYALEAGLDAAIVNYRHILPLNQISEEERELARKVVFNENENGEPALNVFVSRVGAKKERKQKAVDESLPVGEILKQKIINGDSDRLEHYLDEALKNYSPVDILNRFLLEGMKVVGDLFGSGRMQLPFVLKSAEVMKAAVRHLEPYMDRVEGIEKGKIVLATVKGDVHDIGKNLVDIILSNNGYKVYNLGIKVPIQDILKAADEYQVDAIGMSGLLVKSTAIMKENLEEMNRTGHYRIPVLVGGAALTKKFVQETLVPTYRGTVYYAVDAFDGLRIMEQITKSGSSKEPSTPRALIPQKEKPTPQNAPRRSSVSTDVDIPTPPFIGSRVVENIDLDEVYPYINTTALFRGQWQYRKRHLSDEEYAKLQTERIEPIFERLKQECKEKGWLEPKVVYGYFYCQSDGNDLIIYREDRETEWLRFTFPRQKKPPFLCIADYFTPVESGKMDVVAMHLVTVGPKASEVARQLYAEDKYEEYLYLHGLSVETAEALAEYWHKQIRRELGIDSDDADDIRDLFHQKYRGARYSFGYPACPNLEDQAKLFELLRPERIGVRLTEEYMLDPEQSTSAIIVHHPEARYFHV